MAAGPVEYREPQVGDEAVVRRSRARRAVWVGVWGIGASACLMAVPLVMGRWSANKYFVAFGFIGVCWGLSCLFHGAWDWWRGR